MKIYESDTQIVIRGINHEMISTHISSGCEKILCIYDDVKNLTNKLDL